MKSNWKNTRISKDVLARKYFLKKELKLLLLKSFIRNQNVNPILRAYISIKLVCNIKQKQLICSHLNRCLLTGKSKTTFKLTGFSRQSMKKMIDMGLLQNIKSNTY